MVIEPIFEQAFAPQSYGFRPGRSCKDALRRVEELLGSGHGYVVDIDIKGYFDSIPHERLMELVKRKIADGRVLAMIEGFLKAGIMEGMENWEPREGTPQGGVISPLLANIYLDPFPQGLVWILQTSQRTCATRDGRLGSGTIAQHPAKTEQRAGTRTRKGSSTLAKSIL